jgi:hypothetical protein
VTVPAPANFSGWLPPTPPTTHPHPSRWRTPNVDHLDPAATSEASTAPLDRNRTRPPIDRLIPSPHAHPSPTRTTWAADHVAITSIASIGRIARFSPLGSTFWPAEWGYPDIALDYRHAGEPSVQVDQEWTTTSLP